MKRKPRTGSIYLRSDTWWIKYYRQGQPFRESAHSDSYQEAERLLKARQGEIVTGKFMGLRSERIRIATLLDGLLDYYRLQERRSLRMTEQRVRKNLAPAFGGFRAADLGTAHINAYVLKRPKDKAANATINRELELLLRAFRLGFQAEPPLINRVPKIIMLPEENVRTGVLEHEQYLALRDMLPPHYRLLL